MAGKGESSVAAKLHDRHKEKLSDAGARLLDLGCWSGYAEIPSEKIYGEGSKQSGEDSFKGALGKRFSLEGHVGDGETGNEKSPYGIEIGITYSAATVDELLGRISGTQVAAWQEASADERAGVLLEALERLSRRSFETAHAVMHTTGQAFMMAFQAGAAHALDRGLEAVATAHELQGRWPSKVNWEKPQGKRPPMVLDKTYRTVPRGTGIVIGCNTFPTWNGYPGLYASLACGNPVIVKPHPNAVLPLAIAVQEIRETLDEAGYPRDVVQLAVDTAEKPITKELATAPGVEIVDYTGSSAFGQWLEQNCTARVFAEKSGRNSVIVADFADLEGMARNLAMSLSLYSGQMCTSPQDIYIVSTSKPRFDEVASAIKQAVESLLSDDQRAVEILGAIANPKTMDDLASAAGKSQAVLESRKVGHPDYPGARIHTPALMRPGDGNGLERELFGPMAVLYEARNFEDGLAKVAGNARRHGALTALVYADDETLVERFESECARAGVNTAANLTGAAIVNHSTAFSDFHGTGANPAASASLTDLSFVAPRFFIQESKRQAS